MDVATPTVRLARSDGGFREGLNPPYGLSGAWGVDGFTLRVPSRKQAKLKTKLHN